MAQSARRGLAVSDRFDVSSRPAYCRDREDPLSPTFLSPTDASVRPRIGGVMGALLPTEGQGGKEGGRTPRASSEELDFRVRQSGDPLMNSLLRDAS